MQIHHSQVLLRQIVRELVSRLQPLIRADSKAAIPGTPQEVNASSAGTPPLPDGRGIRYRRANEVRVLRPPQMAACPTTVPMRLVVGPFNP